MQVPPEARAPELAAVWAEAPEARAPELVRAVAWVPTAEAPVQLATQPQVALRLRGAEAPPRVVAARAPGTMAVVVVARRVNCRNAALRGGWQWAQDSS